MLKSVRTEWYQCAVCHVLSSNYKSVCLHFMHHTAKEKRTALCRNSDQKVVVVSLDTCSVDIPQVSKAVLEKYGCQQHYKDHAKEKGELDQGKARKEKVGSSAAKVKPSVTPVILESRLRQRKAPVYHEDEDLDNESESGFECSSSSSDDDSYEDERKASKRRRKQTRETGPIKRRRRQLSGHFCTLCPLSFPNEDLLNTHTLSHQNPETGMYHCPFEDCNNRFINANRLTSHKFRIHGIIVRQGVIVTKKVKRRETIKCDDCDATFISRHVLIEHWKDEKHGGFKSSILVEKEDGYYCKLCNYKFENHHTVAGHIKKHESKNSKPYGCEVCHIGFSQKRLLVRHMRMHSENNKFVCDIPSCRRKFRDRACLVRHKTLHEGKRDHKCPICGVGYPRYDYVRKHIRKQHAEGPTAVKTKSRVKGYISLVQKKHPQTAQNDNTSATEPNTPPCKILNDGIKQDFVVDGYVTTSESDIKSETDKSQVEQNQDKKSQNSVITSNKCSISIDSKHQSVQYSIIMDTRSFPCRFCLTSFQRFAQLKKHIMAVHPQEAPEPIHEDDTIEIRCGICSQKMDSKQDLKTHMLGHTRGKEFRCTKSTKCSSRFKSSAQLDAHVQKFHNDENRKFKCDKCGAMFVSLYSLGFHKKRHELPLVKCAVCNAMLKGHKSLELHMKSHDPNRKLSECGICGDKLSNHVSLRRHIRLVHSNARMDPKNSGCGNSDEILGV